ncbi:Asp-tRNA(Asn)/Glu-tRNA(Gln) amidotransferase subunit GatB [Methanospirillum sp.]|uniref:Asp-tRNA(Asn)/Glu-tRNA(Gln) amidotransferase subunit GatB n=1 Tax=Methanospirillum sp. TaxID=45200 RepID=UPI0035A06E78
MEEREIIIGLEIHCQLNTKSKLFCGCSTDFHDDEPNTHTCPDCLGLPGSMPKVNKCAIEYALKVAKALNCSIREESEFSRKHYFYPDLNKAFQITQHDKPLAEWGKLLIDGDNGEKEIRITRIHLEEDPGRSVHMGTSDRGKYTLIDYNRAGTPLIEIVTEPDLRSPKEARKFLNKLRATLEYLNVFDSEKEGSLRVDANISLKGSSRVEVKNISSYKGVEKALTFEITRQRNLLRRGQTVARETRHFVETRGVTTSSRSKEEENDYRYFPDPDLPLLRVASWVDGIELPELPDARRERFISQYGISPEHAKTLVGGLKLAEFYESVALEDPVLAATWTADYLLGELNYRDFSIDAMPAGLFKELLTLIKTDTVTDKSAVEILRMILDAVKEGKKPEHPQEIVSRLGLAKTSGDQITGMIQEVIAEQQAAVDDYYAGKMQALNFLVGQVMKKCRGRADPGHLNTLLKEILDKKA